MKLNRELVIQKLEAQIVRSEKKDEARIVKAQKQYDALVKKVERGMAALPTVGTRQYKALYEAMTRLNRQWNPSTHNARPYHAYHGNAGLRDAMRTEIGLLKLSTDESVTIRTNSDLARWLSA